MTSSWWPWKKTSRQAFEKMIPIIAAQIAAAKTKEGSLRKSARRVKLVIAVYGSFVYTLAALVLIFVVGYTNWGPSEVAVLGGGPLLLYLLRIISLTYYEWMISRSSQKVERLEKDRDEMIAKLKEATNYTETQKLIKLYGGTEHQITDQNPSSGGKKAPQTSFHKKKSPDLTFAPSTSLKSSFPASELDIPADSKTSYLLSTFQAPPENDEYTPKWYDRLFDILVGPDESLPKNRVALICQHCRMVNGQAPPGKTSKDVEPWGCYSCKRLNGAKVGGDASPRVEPLTLGDPKDGSHQTLLINDPDGQDGVCTPLSPFKPTRLARDDSSEKAEDDKVGVH